MSIEYATPNPYGTEDLAEAYAWIGSLTIDFQAGTGRVGVVVHADGAAAQAGKPPIKSMSFPLGGSPYDGPNSLPDLTTVLTENAEAFGAIRAYLYQQLLGLGEFEGGTEVP